MNSMLASTRHIHLATRKNASVMALTFPVFLGKTRANKTFLSERWGLFRKNYKGRKLAFKKKSSRFQALHMDLKNTKKANY